jgi:glycerol kinase
MSFQAPFVLALDQGTTSSRSLIFDANGQVVDVAQREFTQYFPRPGWVEHDANEIWATQLQTLQALMANQGTRSASLGSNAMDSVACLGLTNQRETTVLWDRATGSPLARAIVWQDRRTAQHCEALKRQGKTSLIQRKTGLVLDAYFCATKLQWLLDNVDGARRRAERGELCAGTIDSWLIYKLTDGRVHATDASNASRTMLFNIHTLDWDDELLRLFEVPRAVLPQVVPSSGVLGYTHAGVVGFEVPIAGVAGDQQAATFGQACFAPGMAKTLTARAASC